MEVYLETSWQEENYRSPKVISMIITTEDGMEYEISETRNKKGIRIDTKMGNGFKVIPLSFNCISVEN